MGTPIPISVYATAREREEFGPKKDIGRMGKDNDSDWETVK
jgi:hypothetical protein